MDLLQLLAGFAILLAGGEFLIRGAVGLAERLGMAPLVIGLTVVAFGTSAPELVVSLSGAYAGSGGIAIGNVVGSNIANVLLILAVPSLLQPTPCRARGLRGSVFMMLGVTAIFMMMLATGSLGRLEGLALFAILAGFTWYQLRIAGADISGTGNPAAGSPVHSPVVLGALVLGGLAALPLGAEIAVRAAVRIAEALGVSQALIGLTVVAVGTSLPELAASLVAALRGQGSIALGNIIGSNIFNIACIMGVTATLFPLAVPERMISFDMWVMALATLAAAGFVFLRQPIGRKAGLALLAGYCIYVVIAYAY
jgi:cation:H+ antiporter